MAALEMMSGDRLLLLGSGIIRIDARGNGAIPAAGANAVLLEFGIGEFHGNGAPATIRIRLRVITHEV